MKNKLTETKLKPSIGLTRHLISGVLCFAVISLICSSASAQNLFVRDSDVVGVAAPSMNSLRTECEASLPPG